MGRVYVCFMTDRGRHCESVIRFLSRIFCHMLSIHSISVTKNFARFMQ